MNWISVHDSKPPDNVTVIVANGYRVVVDVYHHVYGWYDSDSSKVTHWMPFPTYPSDEETNSGTIHTQ